MTVDKGLGYTGSAGRTFVTAQAKDVAHKQAQQSLARADERNQLLPSEEIINDVFEKLIDELRLIDFVSVKGAIAIGNNALEIDMLSNEKAIEKLKSAKTQVTNLLRDNKGGKNE